MATPDEFFKPNAALLEKLSRQVQAYRKRHAMTQAQLAEACGFHEKFIQSLETRRRNLSLSAFVQLAKGMKISPTTLLGRLLRP